MNTEYPTPPANRSRLAMRASIAVTCAVLLVTLGWLVYANWSLIMPKRSAIPANDTVDVGELQDPIYDTQIMPLSASEAERLNALRAVDVTAIVPARPFIIPANSRSEPHFASALQCLQQAVYYEAGYESAQGQRGVAQTVLNRVKHPAFPNSVCGVVYQGSERWTGCQFTFTCDGSLARRPAQSAFARAGKVAAAALSGTVEESVGTSTHYHADYVLPYWAGTLDKVNAIGAHIFYAMRGSPGSPGAFIARYNLSGEFVRQQASADIMLTDDVEDEVPSVAEAAPTEVKPALAEDLRTGKIAPKGPNSRLRSQPGSVIRADEASGELKLSNKDSKLIID